MNREIKFRAFHKEDQSMIVWPVMKQSAYNTGQTSFVYEVLVSDKDLYNVMQFSGIIALNNKDIYDGDIIQSLDSKGNKIIHVIEYSENEGRYIAVNVDGMDHLISKNSFGLKQDWVTEFKKEVIGNIYQHKHLLK